MLIKQIRAILEARISSYRMVRDWLLNQVSLSSWQEGVLLLLSLYIDNVYERAFNVGDYRQLCFPSLGCVQRCTVYHCPFYLELTVDKPHRAQDPKLMPRCRDFWVSNTGEHRFESYTTSFS